MKTSITKLIKKIIIIFIWLFIWELCSLFINNDILLPDPIKVLFKILELLPKGYFWISIFNTIMRVITALVVSIGLGLMLGIFAGLFTIVQDFFQPIMGAIKSTPLMSIIIIALVWFRAGNVVVFTAVLICLPIIYTNTLEGIKSVDNNLLKMAKLYKVKEIYIIKDIYLPSIKNYVVSGILMCLGLGWKVAVASEVLSTPKYSVGLNLLNAKAMLDTEELFAWTIVVVTLSLLFESGFRKLVETKRQHLGKSTAKISERFKKHLDKKTIIKHNTIHKDYKHNYINETGEYEVELLGVYKNYGSKKVLENINFKFAKNKITAILGPSGRGKTSLLNIISGIEKASSGNVVLQSKSISYMFQEDRLIPWLTVYDNIAFVLKSEYCKDEISQIVDEYLHLVKLEEYAQELPEKLSGGMKRRVAMARTFAYPSDLILMDEPFKGLDEELKNEIIDGFLKLWTKHKNTVIFVTHDIKEVKKLGQVIYNLE